MTRRGDSRWCLPADTWIGRVLRLTAPRPALALDSMWRRQPRRGRVRAARASDALDRPARRHRRKLMTNVAVTVEDEPPPGQPLLGLYQGVPWGRRGPYYARRAAGQDHDLPRPDRADLRRRPGEAAALGPAHRLPRDRAPFRDQRRATRRDRPLLRRELAPRTASWFSAWRMRCSSCHLSAVESPASTFASSACASSSCLLRPRGVDLARRDRVVDERDRAVLEHLEEARAGGELAHLAVAEVDARRAGLEHRHERRVPREHADLARRRPGTISISASPSNAGPSGVTTETGKSGWSAIYAVHAACGLELGLVGSGSGSARSLHRRAASPRSTACSIVPTM